jgi:hypothetical protein
VNGNNGLEIQRFVLAEKQILVIIFFHVIENGVHCMYPSKWHGLKISIGQRAERVGQRAECLEQRV